MNMASLLETSSAAETHAQSETPVDFVTAANELAANFSMDGIDATFVDEDDGFSD